MKKKGKTIIKYDACMNFYNLKEPIYLETDTSGVGQGAGLLQVRDGMQFPRDEVTDNKHCVHNICKQEPIQCRDKIP